MNLQSATIALSFQTAHWTLDDFRLLADIAENEIRCAPLDLIKVMCIESTMDPGSIAYDVATKAPAAVGLNQITMTAAIEMKLVKKGENARWAAMLREISQSSIQKQLYLVARYFDAVPWGRTGKPYDAEKLYQSNFAPYSLPAASKPSSVITERGEKLYAGNPDLDVNHDGKITVGDLQAAVDGVPYAKRTALVYAASVVMLRAATGSGP